MKRNHDLTDLGQYAFWLKIMLNTRLLDEYGHTHPHDLILWVDELKVTLSVSVPDGEKNKPT